MIDTTSLEFSDAGLQQELELMRGPKGAWRIDREVQIRALEKLGLRAGHRFLEIGCGPLVAGAPLIRFLQPGHYTGVDISEERLNAARSVTEHFGLHGRNPRLLLSETFGTDQLQPGSFDRIWSFQVVIHFALPVVRRFLDAVALLLAPDGIGWFSARAPSDHDDFATRGSWLEFPVTEAGRTFYASAADAAGLACISLGTLAEWGLPRERPGAKNLLFQVSRRIDEGDGGT